MRFPWDVVALKAALLPTEIWDIPQDLKILLNTREGNESTTLREASIARMCPHQSEYFLYSPLFFLFYFIFYVFSLTKHFFEASVSDRYVSDN